MIRIILLEIKNVKQEDLLFIEDIKNSDKYYKFHLLTILTNRLYYKK
jgi:hypothetical protein